MEEEYSEHEKEVMQQFYAICKKVIHDTCGKGLKIMHIGPILLNGRAIVGEDCVFHINTALVAGGSNDDTPVLV